MYASAAMDTDFLAYGALTDRVNPVWAAIRTTGKGNSRVTACCALEPVCSSLALFGLQFGLHPLSHLEAGKWP